MKAQWNSPDYDYKADDEFNALVNEVIEEVIVSKESSHKMMDWRGKYFKYIQKWAQKLIKERQAFLDERKEYFNELRLGI